jgi:hypothetical protein
MTDEKQKYQYYKHRLVIPFKKQPDPFYSYHSMKRGVGSVTHTNSDEWKEYGRHLDEIHKFGILVPDKAFPKWRGLDWFTITEDFHTTTTCLNSLCDGECRLCSKLVTVALPIGINSLHELQESIGKVDLFKSYKEFEREAKVKTMSDYFFNSNKEIHEFMGHNCVSAISAINTTYHKSWDSLMPVIDKIEEMGFLFTMQKHQAQVFDTSKEYPKNFLIDADFHDDKFLNSYEAVVSFVKMIKDGYGRDTDKKD